MAKRDKTNPEQIEQADALLSIPALITEWVKQHVPQEIHDKINSALSALADVQDGFNRNGNRTDYRRDQLAFASAGIEPTADGPVLVVSTMKGRRVADIVRVYLLEHVSTFVYPPTERKDGKMQSHRPARERWVSGLGFEQQEAGSGKRWNLVQKAGTDELLAEIEKLVPERFEGTELPTSTKSFLKLVLPSELGGLEVSVAVYDPEKPNVTEEKFRADLERIMPLLRAGGQFSTDRKGNPTRLGELYLAAFKASQQAAQAAA